jgi:hypothetical protein
MRIMAPVVVPRITLFESEEEMRRGDEALNAMNLPGGTGRRVSVDFYEVPVHRIH